MSDIIGTAAAETLYGTSGSDIIVGGGGADTIFAGRGNDNVTGSDDGNDRIYGEAGNDSIDGLGGNDVLVGGAGDDVVHGGDGNDSLYSTERTGSDSLYGDAGDDYIEIDRYIGTGTLFGSGGSGNDSFWIDVRSGATVTVDAGDGDDRIELNSPDAGATLTLGAGRDAISFFSPTLFNGSTVSGAKVTDFQVGPGGDIIDLADAIVDYALGWNPNTNPFTAAGVLTLTQSGADTLLKFQGNTILVLQNVTASSLTAENFAGISPTGTVSTALNLTGDDSGNVLSGGSGDDVIDGAGGRDLLYGGFGADTLSGGDGNDYIKGGAGNDTIQGGAGRDSLYGGFGDDIVHGGADNDFLSDNDTGVDILYGDEGDDDLWVQRDSSRSGGSSTLVGGEGSDRLNINTYNSDAVIADGGVGDDRVLLYNLSGSLTVTLGDGADVLDFGSWSKSATSTASIVVTDFATGAAGDRLYWSSFLARGASGMAADANPFATGYARLVQIGGDTLLQFDRDGGANSFVTLVTFKNVAAADLTSFNLGGFSSDGTPSAGLTLAGTDAADRMFGDGGADTIGGGGDNDTIYGLGGADALAGGDGNDTIYGGTGGDTIDGGDGDDSLYGEQGADTVHGGLGNDYIVSDAGTDAVYGDDGNDTLIVSRSSGSDNVLAAGGSGNDWIQYSVYGGTGALTFDGGEGDDTVELLALHTASVTVTLGAGQDRLLLQDFTFYSFDPGRVVITDFQAGDGGDRVAWSMWLSKDLPSAYDTSKSPFAAGYAKLVQVGTDAVVQVSMTGTGGTYKDFIVLKNTDVWALTAYNFDGYETPYTVTHGTSADETFSGGTGNDGFDGGGGNDTFLIGYGGNDYAAGGAGDDTFFVALTSTALTARIVGGGGTDLLQLQGHGAQALTIGTSAASGTLINPTGVQTIQFLASADASHNWGLGAAAAYAVTLQDAVAAAGTTLTIDASGLGSTDSLSFSTDEKDAALTVTGGAGNDSLHGGAMADVLSGGGGNDTLYAAGGNDQLDGGTGNDFLLYTAAATGQELVTATGGAGTDILSADFSALATPLTWSLTPDGLGGYSGFLAAGSDHRIDFTGIERFVVIGGMGADDISTGDGGDLLSGGVGNDVLHGNGGADSLSGGTGLDTLIGGTGNDTYVLVAAEDASDTIVENAGEGTDEIDTDFASYTLGANLENLFGNATTGQTLTGNELANYIDASTGNDVLNGLGGNDTLRGDLGNDTLDGGTGADAMDGDSGNDFYYVDDVGDTVTDASGVDEIRTALASYTMTATGIEFLTGTSATGQALTGGIGNDVITGGVGDDVLDGGAGVDNLRGGKGDDTYYVDNIQDFAVETAGQGYDTVFTSVSFFTLSPNVEALTGTSAAGQTLIGNSGDNVVTAAGGTDVIRLQDGGADKAFGNGGNDVIFFGAAMTSADEADGGAGSDFVALQGNYSAGVTLGANLLVNVETLQVLTRTDQRYGGSGVTANAYNLTSVDSNVAAGTQLFVDASALVSNEALVFDGSAETDGTFKVTGGAAADTITGGAGADLLTGGSGDDLLDGRGGADTMAGGSGNDVYVVDSASDTVTEFASQGSDEIRTALAAYTLTAANVEILRGTSNAGQALTAGAASHTIVGAAGNDLLDDGAYAATLKGGLGDDIYAIHVGTTSIVENAGEGTDTVRSYATSYTLSANLENLAGMLSTSQTLIGNGSANAITGGSGDDRIDGGAGADAMAGGLGNDTYVADNAGDTVSENAGEGTDTVETSLAAYTLADNFEKLTGTASTGQALTGNAAANTLAGGSGNDTLVGGAGNDTLVGGAGTDTASYAGGAAVAVSVTSASAGQVVVGGAETDTFSSVEKIVGSAFADTFTNNVTTGMTFEGGAGDDTYYLLGGNDTVIEAAGGGTDRIVTAAATYALGANVENLTGLASGFQDLRGNALDNELVAGSGGALLRLQDGGRDHAVGGNGSDTLYFGGAFDSLDLAEGGAGSDVLLLQGSYSNLALGANATGIETLELMSHVDNRFGAAAAGSNHYVIASSGFQMSGPFLFVDGTKLDSSETLSFDGSAESAVAFVLDGGAGSDILKGGALGDTLDGGAGADSMAGGEGNDFYWVRDLSDSVDEAVDAGTDSVRTLLASYTLAANVETLIGDLASTRNQSLTGNALSNNITAGAGDDVLDGGGGASDYLDGGAGNDRLLVHQLGFVSASGGTGTDTLVVDYSASTSAIEASVQTFSNGQGGTIHDGEGRWTSFSSIETLDITAGSGDDHIVTGDGDDYVDGGAGSDVLEGGGGNDGLYDLSGSAATMRGGSGDDYIYYRRYFGDSWQSATIEAGDGNDKVAFATFSAGASASIDLGAGDDSLYLDERVGSELFVTTGAGRDTLQITGLMDGQSTDVIVTDFQTGPGGDSIDWATAFPFAFGAHGYQQGSNPFAQGYARLVQVGSDTVLQISANADGNFRTILTFQNHAPSDFTADNLGWAPVATQPAGTNPYGTSGDDWLAGTSAGTFFHLEQGGDDLVTAGSGNDAFYFGAALTSADRIDGGAGADQLALQGDYWSGLTLGAGQLRNIETLVVLPHDDLRFGGGGADPYRYDLTLTDDAVAAGQQLKVNASTLKAGESFTFDGSAETNGSFFLYGGKGMDTFTGGSGADVFFFVEDGRYAPTDHVDGGAGLDAMVLRGDYNLTLSADSLVNVETVVFLSGTDARFYASGTDFHYAIATADNTVGAGVTMTFNGGALRGTETLSFDGSAETDGHMRIFGGAADDHIIGGGQSDLIFGGGGADVLTGGGGNDSFRYQGAAESSVGASDHILDFTAGDIIDLGRIDAVTGGGDDPFRLVDAFDGHAGQLVAAQGADNVWTVSGDVDGNGQADFQILVTVADGHLLGMSDFVL